MKYHLVITIIIFFSLSVGCLSNSKDEDIRVSMLIHGGKPPMIFRCNLYYINDENTTDEILLTYTYNFTDLNVGASPYYYIPKKDNNLYFTIELFNNSVDESPFLFEERIIDNVDNTLFLEIYNLGMGQEPKIDIYRDVTGGIP